MRSWEGWARGSLGQCYVLSHASLGIPEPESNWGAQSPSGSPEILSQGTLRLLIDTSIGQASVRVPSVSPSSHVASRWYCLLSIVQRAPPLASWFPSPLPLSWPLMSKTNKRPSVGKRKMHLGCKPVLEGVQPRSHPCVSGNVQSQN